MQNRVLANEEVIQAVATLSTDCSRPSNIITNCTSPFTISIDCTSFHAPNRFALQQNHAKNEDPLCFSPIYSYFDSRRLNYANTNLEARRNLYLWHN